jgi:hypothetical protein
MDKEENKEAVSWAEFLEKFPPASTANIDAVIFKGNTASGSMAAYVSTPDLLLYCGAESCQGIRTFSERSEKSYFCEIVLQFLLTNQKGHLSISLPSVTSVVTATRQLRLMQ